MKNFLLFLSLWALGTGLFMPSLYAQCPNRCLYFDGVDDQIRISEPGLITAGTDNTLEFWFLSENGTDCSTPATPYFNVLYSFSGSGLQPVFSFGMCGDELFYQIDLATPVSLATGMVNDVWYHIALRVDASGNLDLFLDGVPTYSSPGLPLPDYDNLSFGENEMPAVAGISDHWKGKIDEIRLWNVLRTEQEINAGLHCPCLGNEPGIVVCMPLDQGMSGSDNTSITEGIDEAPLLGANDAVLQDFALTGGISNFVCSETGLIYPVYEELELVINDYFNPLAVLTEICSGEPVRFCLSHDDEMALLPEIIAPGTGVTGNVTWQYFDNTVTDFADIPSFQGFCFPVGQGIITADCAANSDGYTDRQYRVKIEVVESMDINDMCTYYSDPVTLRICCPIGPATVDVTTDISGDLLCEGDEVDFSVSLNSPDDFVTTPGSDVTIEWSYNGIPISFSNQTSFNYNDVIVNKPEACFSAVVTNCGGKTATFEKCFVVDPVPTCGDIIGLSSNLNLISASPLKYEICPGDDAQLTLVDEADFTNGIITWQFKFPSIGTWADLGVSNTIQNTNVLAQETPGGSPYDWPPGENCIVYRVKVVPFSDPSGCEPCYSNELEICLMTAPPADIIVPANAPFCWGDETSLTVGSYNPAYTYDWFWNGLPIGTGEMITTDTFGLFEVVISNGCQNTTATYQLTQCKVTAVISCPLDPNACACEGLPITLSGCDSEDSCDPGNPNSLLYNWKINNGPWISAGGCSFIDIDTPAPNTITTYTLEVTNSMGCKGVTTLDVKPCLKDE